jgi:hypothetical protein
MEKLEGVHMQPLLFCLVYVCVCGMKDAEERGEREREGEGEGGQDKWHVFARSSSNGL